MENNISLLIIYTGGTIGMIPNEKTGALEPFNFDNLYNQLPTLKRYPYQIDFYSFDPLIDSSDVTPEFWIKIVDVIEQRYEHYDGFIILHGTDTMAYTASALSFMLENLNKPVILTGSQLPLGMLRSDGRENLLTSIEIAAAQIDETPVVPEVCIYFQDFLFRGNRTSKNSSENFDAFQSGNYPPLASVGIDVKYNFENIIKPNFKKLKVSHCMDNNVATMKLFPGISQAMVRSVLHIEGLKGLVLETYGSGNSLSAPWFIDMLQDAINRGVVIADVTQCKRGSVILHKYQAGLQLAEIGVISGTDITYESAVTKLMYLFGKGYSPDEVKKYFAMPLRGEMMA